MKKKEKKCNHEWWVWSTCPCTDTFFVHCDRCDAFGKINEPTKQEWLDAFYVPSDPDSEDDEEIAKFYHVPYEEFYWEHKNRVTVDES
jgi:hypothetical protein